MFFNRNITTIFITSGKIRSAVFSSGGKLIKKNEIYDWTEDDVLSALKDIASKGSNIARVVFGEEFSYSTVVKSSENDRGSILMEASESIPEELKNNWDFKKEKNSNFSSQVIAVQPKILDVFLKNFEQADFEIEAIETQSVAIARLVPRVGMFLFFIKDEKILIGAVCNGVVVGTYVLSKDENIAILEKFILSVQKKYNEKITEVFVENKTDIDCNVFLENGLKVSILELNPLYSVAIKKHLSGEDSSVLNIKSDNIFSSKDKENEKQSNSHMSLREKILLGLFIFIIMVGALLIKIKYY